ncbi:hypothetical protein DAI22_03g091501 [Oryza sativa Japonica Group]|nr:hypothetical protein DAI22_03g091501 [Oryza sativa Japonica Group]
MAAAGTVARWCIGGITLCQGETTVSPRHTRTHTQARRAEPRRRDETTRPARATMDHLPPPPPPPPPRAPRMLPRARRRPHADDRTGARCIPLPTHTPPRTTCAAETGRLRKVHEPLLRGGIARGGARARGVWWTVVSVAAVAARGRRYPLCSARPARLPPGAKGEAPGSRAPRDRIGRARLARPFGAFRCVRFPSRHSYPPRAQG